MITLSTLLFVLGLQIATLVIVYFALENQNGWYISSNFSLGYCNPSFRFCNSWLYEER